MAQPVLDNGHYAIKLSFLECVQLGFGYKEPTEPIVLCDNCNNIISGLEDCFYIADLNRLFCYDCGEDWLKSTPAYKEDHSFAVRHYNKMAEKLGLDRVK